MDGIELPPWVDKLSALRSWCAAHLGECGPLHTERVRAWSVVFSVDWSGGTAYLKVLPPGLRSEVLVTEALSSSGVAGVADVLGACTRSGWLLTARLPGEILREEAPRLETWCAAVRAYAALQRETASMTDALLAARARDGRPAAIPALFDHLLARDAMLRSSDEALSADELRRLRSVRPRVVATCDVLSELDSPIGLVHNDLHDGNICHHDGEFVFFDWGDSFVGPVFADLHLITRVFRARTDASAADIAFLRGAYLQGWSHRHDVHEMADHCEPVACILHATTWVTIAEVTGETDAPGVPRWCRRLLEMYGG